MITFREYVYPQSLRAMRDLVATIDPRDPEGFGTITPGDIVWRLYQNLTIEPSRRVRLAYESDRLVGWYWLYPPGGADLFLDPTYHDSENAVGRLLDAAAAELQGAGRVTIDVASHQLRFHRALAGSGFSPSGAAAFHWHLRPLETLPYLRREVVAVTRHLIADRVDVHRDVWAPSKFTREGYDRLRTIDGYDSALDLVSLAPDGRIAAYAIGWYDAESRLGYFEPVGTRKAWRRHGHASSVLAEGMRRMRERGATHAAVMSSADEDRPDGARLYAASGFVPAFTLDSWARNR